MSAGRRPRSIAFVCPGCDRAVHRTLEDAPVEIACAACGRPEPLERAHGAADRLLERCRRCGEQRLYVQKDFNRTVGLWVFVIAAILSVPTWGLSLLAATAIDLGLYFLLGDVTLCYACGTQHRGFPKNPAHGPFDLHVAEAVDRRPRTA